MKTINWKTLMAAVVMTSMFGAPACVMEHGGSDDAEEEEPTPEPTPEPSSTSTLRIENKSSYTIYNLYLWRCTEQPNTHDQLGSKAISPEGTLTLSGVPSGCWYFKARNSTSVFWQSERVTLLSGKQFTWQLFN